MDNKINLLKNDIVLDEIIDNVYDTAWKEFSKKYSNPTLVLVLLALAVPIAIFLYYLAGVNEGYTISLQVSLPFFVLILTMPFLFSYFRISQKIHHAFMMQFARLNNFSYIKNAPLPEEQAHFFFVGYSKRIDNYISGTLFDRPIFLYNYHFVQGSGKSRKYSNYTVFNIDLPYTVPSVIFRPNKIALDFMYYDFTTKVNAYNNKNLINLEGDFGDHFKLWVEKKFEIEALQIFTEKFLAELFLNWKDFHIELIDRNVYVYVDHVISTKVELERPFCSRKSFVKTC